MPDLLIEPIGGASGNMLLGALFDLGADEEELLGQLSKLALSPWRLEGARVIKRGVAALHVDFAIESTSRTWSAGELMGRLAGAGFSERVQLQAESALSRLIDAEFKVRGEEISWPDSAGCDVLLDIAGFFVGLELLEIEGLYCTRLPLGEGSCWHHDVLVPNPNPAVAELLRGLPVRRMALEKETITTTGATLLAAADFVLPSGYAALRMGYGAGRSDFPFSNVVRLSLLETEAAVAHDLLLMETHIDDINPQLLGMLPDRLIDRGAVDAWITTITGKKGRHGFQISVICAAVEQAQLSRFLFSETTTLGVRSWPIDRIVLERKEEVIPTPLGPVEIKTRRLPDGRRRSTLEFESVRRIAEDHGVPVVVAMERLQVYLPPP